MLKNINRFLPKKHPDRPCEIFKKICNHLGEQGAEVIVLGCTDIIVDFDITDYQKIPIIDSLTILTESCCHLF
jgi:aspartate racemase